MVHGSFASSRPAAFAEVLDHRGVFQRPDAESHAAQLPLCRRFCREGAGLAIRGRGMDGGFASHLQFSPASFPRGPLPVLFYLPIVGFDVQPRSASMGACGNIAWTW